MKKIVFLFLLLIFISSDLWAFNFKKGTSSLAGDFEISYEHDDGIDEINVEIEYGYFFIKNL